MSKKHSHLIITLIFALLESSCKEKPARCEKIDYNYTPAQNKVINIYPHQSTPVRCRFVDYTDHTYAPEGLSYSQFWGASVWLLGEGDECHFVDSVFINSKKTILNELECRHETGSAPPSGGFDNNQPRTWQLYDSEGTYHYSLTDSSIIPSLTVVNDHIAEPGENYVVQFTATHTDSILVSLGPINKWLPASESACVFMANEINSLECGRCETRIMAYSRIDTVIAGSEIEIVNAVLYKGHILIKEE